jgi:hypothetical protein
MSVFVPDHPELHSAKESSTSSDTEFTMASIARDAWAVNSKILSVAGDENSNTV